MSAEPAAPFAFFNELGRRTLLGEARRRGVDLLELGTKNPDGSVTLDWETLAQHMLDEDEATEDEATE